MPSGERGVQRGVYQPESVEEGLNLKCDVILNVTLFAYLHQQ